MEITAGPRMLGKLALSLEDSKKVASTFHR